MVGIYRSETMTLKITQTNSQLLATDPSKGKRTFELEPKWNNQFDVEDSPLQIRFLDLRDNQFHQLQMVQQADTDRDPLGSEERVHLRC